MEAAREEKRGNATRALSTMVHLALRYLASLSFSCFLARLMFYEWHGSNPGRTHASIQGKSCKSTAFVFKVYGDRVCGKAVPGGKQQLAGATSRFQQGVFGKEGSSSKWLWIYRTFPEYWRVFCQDSNRAIHRTSAVLESKKSSNLQDI